MLEEDTSGDHDFLADQFGHLCEICQRDASAHGSTGVKIESDKDTGTVMDKKKERLAKMETPKDPAQLAEEEEAKEKAAKLKKKEAKAKAKRTGKKEVKEEENEADKLMAAPGLPKAASAGGAPADAGGGAGTDQYVWGDAAGTGLEGNKNVPAAYKKIEGKVAMISTGDGHSACITDSWKL